MGESQLEKIGKGSTIIFVGFALGTVFQYLYKMVLARLLGPESFGVFVLGFAILQSAAILALFGLQLSMPRYISFYGGKDEPEMVERTISAGLILTTVSSLIASILLLFFSESIALTIFNEPALILPLKIFSMAIPAFALITFLLTMFQGQKDAYHHALLDDFVWSGLVFLLVTGAVLMGYHIVGAAAAYLLSTTLSIVIAVYIYRKKYDHGLTFSNLNFRTLLLFSWPLFLISLFGILSKRFDVLMLGWLKTSTESGIYEVSYSISSYVSLLLNIVGFMFMPVVSELHAQKKKTKITELYKTATRWITTATLPLLAGMLIFPSEIIRILFGADYVQAALPLTLLSIGFFYRVLNGPSTATLISTGENKKLLAVEGITTFLIVVFNLILIPIYGIVGAGLATLTALLIGESLMLFVIKKKIGAYPFNRGFLRLFLAAAASSIVVLVADSLLEPGLIGSVLLGVVLVIIYMTTVFYLDGFDDSDLTLLKNLLDRVD